MEKEMSAYDDLYTRTMVQRSIKEMRRMLDRAYNKTVQQDRFTTLTELHALKGYLDSLLDETGQCKCYEWPDD